ncbi:MAG: hypothetical protein KatS3mg115_0292 [Candidatus Poribacteria bacterium]|nr:MAG: hypothetical protein KatS3mg115_0292 [Candidatus Poribacteria bacterium]
MKKHAEALTYPQIVPYTDRMDYLSAMNNEMGFVLAVERLMELGGRPVEVPEKAHYIRVIMCELNRIASHLLWFGTFAMDTGAMTPFLYAMRDREEVLSLFEKVSGARLLYNYIRIGGVARDLTPDFPEHLRRFLDYFEPNIDAYNDLILYNKIFLERTKKRRCLYSGAGDRLRLDRTEPSRLRRPVGPSEGRALRDLRPVRV